MHSSRSLRRAVLVVAVVSAGALGGCVVVPARPAYGPAYETDVVTVAPPPLRYEAYGPPPVVGSIWIGGYWGWRGGRHDWVPGHWAGPRPGYHWEPHRWVPQGGGWRLQGGFWARG
jgi:hypothetical protein